MSYLSSFGPTSFDISIGGNSLNHCIQLTATTSPANGTYTMSVGTPSGGSCSSATLHDVATVTLNESGVVQSCTFNNRFGGRTWKSMSGSFNSASGSGTINDDSDPRDINGSWSAGDSEPVPHPHEHKHGHHA
jgi:hypothetical protein